MFRKVSALLVILIVQSSLCAVQHPKHHRKPPHNHKPTHPTHHIKTSQDKPRIIGGHEVDIKDYPYQLSLQARGQEIWCGASLIDKYWAVTAAHCTNGVPSSQLKIRAGSSFVDHGGQLVQVQEKFEHPEYDTDSIENDISLLKLKEPVTDQTAEVIRISAKPPRPHQVGVVSGWGTTVEQAPIFPDQLKAVELEVSNDKSCLNEYDQGVYSNMFCAGDGNEKDSCQGDSGGPFAINGTLYGIVSWGNGCGKVPGVYTKVAPFKKFVKRVTKLNGLFN